MRKICIISAFLAVILAFAACDIIDEISGKNNPPGTVSVIGVLLNKTSTSLVVGGTEILFAYIEPSNVTNKNITWSSGSPAVATVSEGGLVTGLSAGTAVIIVTTKDGGHQAACTVTVGKEAVPVTGVSLNKTSTSLVVGGTETLFTAITPSNATNQSVTWSSDNTAVATVSGGGVVTGLSAGTAAITVTTADGGHQASCTVTVIVSSIEVPVTGILLNKESISLPVDGTEKLSAVIMPYNATNQNVIWISGDFSVATVSIDGLVTGVSAGTAKIIASAQNGEHYAICTVTITKVFSDSRYKAVPYEGSDNIISFQEDGLYYYRIYLGKLINIPLYYGSNEKFIWDKSPFLLQYSKTEEETVTETISQSIEETKSITAENSRSKTTGASVGVEATAGFEAFGAKAELTVKTEANWSQSNSYTESIQKSTSTINTLERGKSVTTSYNTTRSWELNTSWREGFYRYTVFSSSDVYLYVIKDPKQPTKTLCFINESMIEGSDYAYLDYSPFQPEPYSDIPNFNKNNTTEFKFDISSLPPPGLTLSGPVRPTGVSLNRTSAILEKGDTVTLTPTITPSNAVNKNVTWSSSNTAVATVSATGTVTAISAGSAIITVKTEDGNLTAACTVTVIPSPISTDFFLIRSNEVKINNGSQYFDQVGFDQFGIDINALKAKGYKTISFYLRLDVKENDSTREYLYLFNSTTADNKYKLATRGFEHTAGQKDSNWWTHYEGDLKFENMSIDLFSYYFVIRYDSDTGIFHDWLNRNLYIKLEIKP